MLKNWRGITPDEYPTDGDQQSPPPHSHLHNKHGAMCQGPYLGLHAICLVYLYLKSYEGGAIIIHSTDTQAKI